MNTLETTLEKVGRVLSNEYGIRLICKGNRCCTDGKNIFLPALPDDIPDDLLNAIRGFCDHEIGHILGKSSFSVGAEFTKKHGGTAFGLLNCLEDLRIEEVMRKRFPGSVLNLSNAYRHAARRTAEQVERGEAVPFMKQLAFAICSRGQGDPDFPFIDPAVYGLAGTIEREIKDSITAPNTKAVAKLAESAWMVVESYLRSLPPDPSTAGDIKGSPATSSTPGDDNDGAKYNVPGEASSSPIRHRNKFKHSKSEASPGSSASTDTGSSSASSPTGGNSSAGDSEPGVIGGLAQDIADSVSHYADITKAYRVWSRERDEVSTPSVDTSVSHAERMAPLTRHVAGVRQKLVLSLMAEDRVRWLPDQDAGKLNPRALHRLASAPLMRRAAKAGATGTDASPRVFRQQVAARRMKTAVTLLIDLSHSMNGRKLEIARNTALVLCESLECLNIPVSIWGFSTTHYGKAIKEASQATGISVDELEKNYRFAPLVHENYKQFNESFRRMSGRFQGMRTHMLTPLGESMLFAAKDLSRRNEPRKVMLVLTDGRPTVGMDADVATFQHAKDSIVRIERAGIEVLLVGILEHCVHDLHHRSVVVDSLDSLPGTVMTQFHKLLTRAGQPKPLQAP